MTGLRNHLGQRANNLRKRKTDICAPILGVCLEGHRYRGSPRKGSEKTEGRWHSIICDADIRTSATYLRTAHLQRNHLFFPQLPTSEFPLYPKILAARCPEPRFDGPSVNGSFAARRAC